MRCDDFENLIIGVTGNALDDDISAFMEAGADIVLMKPMRPQLLDVLLGTSYTFIAVSRLGLMLPFSCVCHSILCPCIRAHVEVRAQVERAEQRTAESRRIEELDGVALTSLTSLSGVAAVAVGRLEDTNIT